MRDHLLTFAFLLAAFAFYFLGMVMPAGLFMLLGALAEIVFWVRLFTGKARRSKNYRFYLNLHLFPNPGAQAGL